jgi:AMP-binding enzyme
VMHAVQQPLAGSTFTDVMGVPAWKSLPSWYLVATQDQAIPPDAERLFASRMGATTIEVPVPNTETRIVDPVSGADLGTGQDGEVWVRGPQVMKGYLSNRQATAATVGPGGWLRTGADANSQIRDLDVVVPSFILTAWQPGRGGGLSAPCSPARSRW